MVAELRFPSLVKDDKPLTAFLETHMLNIELFHQMAEAVCATVHDEDENLDIQDLVLGIRNNAAFRTLAEHGSDHGLFQKRPKSGKVYLANIAGDLRIMVHNTDAATGLGKHVPQFLSKRPRRGTSYVHSEAQAEMDLIMPIHEVGAAKEDAETTIDVCVFAEKQADGEMTCRLELLVDAEMNNAGTKFETCRLRFGIDIGDDLLDIAPSKDEGDDDDGEVVVPVSPRG